MAASSREIAQLQLAKDSAEREVEVLKGKVKKWMRLGGILLILFLGSIFMYAGWTDDVYAKSPIVSSSLESSRISTGLQQN